MEQNEKKTASTLAFHHPDFEFDDIAENIFLPIYEVIATDLLEETGVVSGQMLDIGCGGGHLGRPSWCSRSFSVPSWISTVRRFRAQKSAQQNAGWRAVPSSSAPVWSRCHLQTAAFS